MNNVMISVVTENGSKWNVVFGKSYKSLWYAKRVFNRWIKKTKGQRISALLTADKKVVAVFNGINRGEYRA